MKLEGQIVFDGQFNDNLLDMQTGNKIPLSQKDNEDLFYMSVSPDGKWLAYLGVVYDQSRNTELEKWLVVATRDGQQYKVIPWEENWFFIAQWLDNERLVIIRQRWNNRNMPFELDSVIMLNPFTGERQELLPDFPDIYDGINGILWGGYDTSRTIYDPTLTRVIYPMKPYYQDWASATLVSIILADAQTGQTIDRLYSVPMLYGTTPQWSPDGKRFVTDLDPTLNGDSSSKYVGGAELYNITRDGQITRLTYLTTHYVPVIYDYSWSPDNRHIAFWLAFGSETDMNAYREEKLAVLDIITGEVTNYCIPGDFHNDSSPAPIWSPDGQQLVVVSKDESDINHRDVILVDIVHGWAAKIAEDVSPVGWMTSP